MAKKPSLKSLKPALAGLVLKHSSRQEHIYSCFVDLVQKGYIDCRGPAQRQQMQRTKKSASGLCAHERALLDIIYDGVIPEAEIRRLLSKNQADFEKALIDDAISLGLYSSFFMELKERTERTIKSNISVVLLFSALSIYTILTLRLDLSGITLDPISFLIVFVIPALLLLQALPSYNDFLRRSSTDQAKNLSKRYHELYSWLKKHPLKEARWSNEYLPYAIAFGIYKDYKQFPK